MMPPTAIRLPGHLFRAYDGMALTDAESFGGNLVQTITVNTEGTGYDVPLLLQWNQAYSQATSDLEILVFNNTGRLVGAATNASSGEPNNPWIEYDFSQSGTYYVAIEISRDPIPDWSRKLPQATACRRRSAVQTAVRSLVTP